MWRVTGTTDVIFRFIIIILYHTDTLPSLVPPGEQSLYSSPFFRDFWHLNVAMMTSNNALIPDPDKEDVLASKPTDWPWMHLGLRMCGWSDNQVKYYLLGTPIIWWTGTASLILSLFVLGIYLLRMQRRYNDYEPGVLFRSTSKYSLIL
jgi:dolichyl-phosphate-mannose-protein mannosyltransferase